jgi:hypothetical protein
MIHGDAFRRRYRAELAHASVVVGLNTTAMIDAAIFGKPVCTVELPALAPRQRGTVHFEYLTTAGGGLLRTATGFDEHVRTLGDLVRRDPYARDEQSDRFVRAFVRPRGIDIPANEIFVQEMHGLLEAPAEARVPGRSARTAGRLVQLAAPVLGAPFEYQRPLQRVGHTVSQSGRGRVKKIRHLAVVAPLGARARLARLRPRRGPKEHPVSPS